jgi:hypothetical protein
VQPRQTENKGYEIQSYQVGNKNLSNALQRCMSKTQPLRSGLVHHRFGMHGGTHGEGDGNDKENFLWNHYRCSIVSLYILQGLRPP